MAAERIPIAERARDRWLGILPALGIDARILNGKHHPCPICGGKDRFRYDSLEGRGTWICSHCGAGDGMKLVMLKHGLDFKGAVALVEPVLGTAPVTTTKAKRSVEDNRAAMNRLWASSGPVQAGDPVDLYLRARTGLSAVSECLRTARRVRYEAELPTYHPAMIAMVTGPDGQPATLHRTYLTAEGRKAEVESPRRLMPGTIPKGSAVRLTPPAEVLGIAEGIETALSASSLFGVPCWSALNATMLQEWVPPPEVREVIVFGDHDLKFAGQAAAFRLAHRLAVHDRRVKVEIPGQVGTDWNDVLKRKAA